MSVTIVVRGDRGFHGYGAEPLVCTYGSKVEAYESSSAHGPHCWLKIDASAWDPECDRPVTAHLDEAKAREVVARLQARLDEIPSRWSAPTPAGIPDSEDGGRL